MGPSCVTNLTEFCSTFLSQLFLKHVDSRHPIRHFVQVSTVCSFGNYYSKCYLIYWLVFFVRSGTSKKVIRELDTFHHNPRFSNSAKIAQHFVTRLTLLSFKPQSTVDHPLHIFPTRQIYLWRNVLPYSFY